MISGTVINAAAVFVGTTVGLTAGKRLRSDLRDNVIKAMGLAVLVIGMRMAFEDHDFFPILLSIVVGTFIGELIDIEARLDRFGGWLQKRTKSDSSTFVLGFVTASVLFCVGSLTIIGAIKDGMQNDPSILYVKSLLDGISAIALASTLGIGVGFSIIVIIVYQGGLSLIAWTLGFSVPDPIYLNAISVTGGVIIIGIGLNLIGITKLRTGNMLPALFVAPLYDFILRLF